MSEWLRLMPIWLETRSMIIHWPAQMEVVTPITHINEVITNVRVRTQVAPHITCLNDHQRSGNGGNGSNSFRRDKPHQNITPYSWNRPRTGNNREPDRTKSNDAPPCPACPNKRHFLWFCKKFKTWTYDQRISFLGEKRLCLCCLSAGHQANACPAPGCPECNQAKHNGVICPKKLVFHDPNRGRRFKKRD